MTKGPSPRAARLMALKVGQSTFIPGKPQGYIETASKHTGQTYSREACDGGFMVRRVS